MALKHWLSTLHTLLPDSPRFSYYLAQDARLKLLDGDVECFGEGGLGLSLAIRNGGEARDQVRIASCVDAWMHGCMRQRAHMEHHARACAFHSLHSLALIDQGMRTSTGTQPTQPVSD